MWKKWGPVVCFAIITAVLLFGSGFVLVEIKKTTDSRIDLINNRLDVIQSGLAEIRTAADNIDAGLKRIDDGLSVYEIGYYASLSGLSSTVDGILASYEDKLNERIAAIKSGK